MIVNAIGNNTGLGSIRQLIHIGIIRIQHSNALFFQIGEQLFLRFEVMLDRTVKIQMVIGQVTEHSDIKIHALHTSQLQTVRADLQSNRLHAMLHHILHRFMNQYSIRRCQRRRQSHLSIADGYRSNIATGRKMGIFIPNNAGDGALPVCSGNTEHLHFTAWMPIKHGRHPIQCAIDIFHLNIGYPFFHIVYRLGMHDAFYTLFNDIINKFMPVMHHALHAEIHIIRLGAAGIDALADSQPANPRPVP